MLTWLRASQVTYRKDNINNNHLGVLAMGYTPYVHSTVDFWDAIPNQKVGQGCVVTWIRFRMYSPRFRVYSPRFRAYSPRFRAYSPRFRAYSPKFRAYSPTSQLGTMSLTWTINLHGASATISWLCKWSLKLLKNRAFFFVWYLQLAEQAFRVYHCYVIWSNDDFPPTSPSVFYLLVGLQASHYTTPGPPWVPDYLSRFQLAGMGFGCIMSYSRMPVYDGCGTALFRVTCQDFAEMGALYESHESGPF
jgi:hypothetical protein